MRPVHRADVQQRIRSLRNSLTQILPNRSDAQTVLPVTQADCHQKKSIITRNRTCPTLRSNTFSSGDPHKCNFRERCSGAPMR
jgi:hypothetical protein